MFFICSGDQAGVIKPTALGFHSIKTLLYRCTTCKNFKRIPALRLRLVPRPLGRLQGGQLPCFYEQEVQNAHYPPRCAEQSSCGSSCNCCPSLGSSDARPAVPQQDGAETNQEEVFVSRRAVIIQRYFCDDIIGATNNGMWGLVTWDKKLGYFSEI